MIRKNDNPLERLVRLKRLPTLFIGSGLSLRYLEGYPNWNELLKRLSVKIGLEDTIFSALIQGVKKENNNASNGKVNQVVASKLEDKIIQGIANKTINPEKLFSKEELVQINNHNKDIFKVLVAQEFRKMPIKKDVKKELELLKQLAEKTSIIFTTNYDSFLESIFDKFKVYNNQDKYYFRDNFGYGEIYKLHGCISDPNSFVITDNDYAVYAQSMKLITSKLINTLADFPIIFLGYSLEDENIVEIIHSFLSCFTKPLLEEISKNMIYISHKKEEMSLEFGEVKFNHYGNSITMASIKTDNFCKIYEYLVKLEPCASPQEIRRYKKLFANLTREHASGKQKIYNIDEVDLDGLNNSNTVISFGSKNNIEVQSGQNKYGVLGLTAKELLEYALYNNVDIPFDIIATDWYAQNKIPRNNGMPAEFIKKNLSIKFGDTSDEFQRNYEYLNNFDYGKFFGNVAICDNYTSLQAILATEDKLDVRLRCYMQNYANGKISKKDYRNLLIDEYAKNKMTTTFRKAIYYIETK